MKIYSLLSFLLAAILLIYSNLGYYPKYNKPYAEATIGWDVSGYYWYLPATFIYKDVKKLAFADTILNKYAPTPNYQQAFLHPKSQNYVMKYPCGLALQMLPAFLVADYLALPLGYERDGFSLPYQLAIQLNGLFWALLSLWLLRQLLLYYYEDRHAAAVIFLYVAGSNYLNYAGIDTAMTHNYLFGWYVILMLKSRDFYQYPDFKNATFIGLIVGILALTRPTELIAALIPLLWGVDNLEHFKQRIGFIFNNLNKYIVAIFCTALIGSLQLFYWKYAAGDWIVYSYQEQGFTWKRPHVWDYTFSYRSGWLLYSPMLIFAVLGLIPLFFQRRANVWAVILFSLLNYYIVCAWDIWWYGGRAMVQSYAVWAFALAALLVWLEKYKWLNRGFYLLAAVFIYYNIWLTHQWHKGRVYDGSDVSAKYFWATLGRWTVPLEYKKMLDTDEFYYQNLDNLAVVYANDFEQDSSLNLATLQPINGQRSEYLNAEKMRTIDYNFALRTDKKWLRAEAVFAQPQKEWTWYDMAQFIVRFTHKGKIIKEKFIRPARLINDGETKPLFFDVKIPETTFDSVSIHFWNTQSRKMLIIDDLKVAVF